MNALPDIMDWGALRIHYSVPAYFRNLSVNPDVMPLNAVLLMELVLYNGSPILVVEAT